MDSINKNFPDEIKKQINKEIDFIFNFKERKNDDWDNFNNNKLILINKFYKIFKQRLNNIKNNHNLINLSLVELKLIIDKIKELQT